MMMNGLHTGRNAAARHLSVLSLHPTRKTARPLTDTCSDAMEDPHAVVGDAPVLYVADGSLPCQVARLVLVEKGVHHSVRGLNTGALEQVRSTPGCGQQRGATPCVGASASRGGVRGLGTLVKTAPFLHPPRPAASHACR